MVLQMIYGGGGRIRTSEGVADRFTVCSLWPLGNPSISPAQIPSHNKQPNTGTTLATTHLELAMGLEPATC